eukprot:6307110-Prymnesium_polylepis.1
MARHPGSLHYHITRSHHCSDTRGGRDAHNGSLDPRGLHITPITPRVWLAWPALQERVYTPCAPKAMPDGIDETAVFTHTSQTSNAKPHTVRVRCRSSADTKQSSTHPH